MHTVLLRRKRQNDGEGAALAWFAGDVNCPGVRIHNMLHNAQTDSDALSFAAKFGAAAVKALENFFAFGGWDAGPLVVDLYVECGGRAKRRHRFGCIMEC